MKKKKIVLMVLIAIILVYIYYAVYLLIVNPTDAYIIKEGAISEEDTATGYIIRNEIVIKGENYENGIYSIVSEGEKVAKSDSIFRYYSDSEKEISMKITEIDYKIQVLLEQEKDDKTSADIKAIENQIQDQIENIRKLTNYQEIKEYKNSIDSLISKKIKFIENVTKNNEIKQLIKERISYEEKLKNGSEYIKSPISGLVSYRVDGLEEKFSIDNFSNITPEFLEEVDLKTGQIISTSNESGKVIDNFKCYIAVTMDSEKSMEAKVGDDVQIRASNKEEMKAKVAHINEQSGKRTIIFKVDKMTENLMNHRKMAVDVIWWSGTGLKVPNQALIEENGLNYVLRNRAGIQNKVLVKVIGKNDKFSIIKTYSVDELKEIGYNEKDIKNYKKIKNYDEIILKP